MREEYGLVLTVQQAATWRPLDQGMRAALFQIVRELLFNVVKHAGVGAATVVLNQTEQTLTLVVSDAGVGFDAERATADGQGLRQARQRVELYGGRLKLDTRPGAGTAVTITVPLPPT
jgi:signal transduction histidine kinase